MSPYFLLAVGAVGLLGCLILLFVGLQMLREERAKKEAGEAAGSGAAGASVVEAGAPGSAPGEPISTAAAPVPAPPVGPNPLASFGERLGLRARPKGSAHEVLRVLRDNLTGRLVVEMGGKRYGQAADVEDPATYQGLLTTLRDLHDFAGVEGAPPPDAAPRAVPLPSAEPPAPHSPAAEKKELARASTTSAGAATPARTPTPTGSAKPLPPPSMNPFKQMQVLRELAKIPEAPTLTIAEQVDEVLQARLLGTPLVNRGIRMRPGPRGDAIFEFEGQSYGSVDEVPDAEVRDLIRSAIAAWEGK
jgi:hypothetical protein